MKNHRMNYSLRSAVTLIEVMFSIGVVLIGLLGLLSVMPLAAKRSQEANSLIAAATYGDSVMNELLSRKLVSNGHLRTTSNTSVSLASPICIDPLMQGTLSLGSVTANHYDTAQFPYLSVSHDPLLNPSDSSLQNWPAPRPSITRVGLGFPTDKVGTLDQGRLLSESNDDLNFVRPNDRSRPAEIRGLLSGTLNSGRHAPTGEFTWMATINPTPDDRYAKVSVAVIRKRNGQRDFPDSLVTKPLQNGRDERLAYLTSKIGFKGGTGGVITIVASQTIDPTVRSNDWVLISQNRSVDGIAKQIHQWYRVVSVDSEPEMLETGEPHPNKDTNLNRWLPTPKDTKIWRREITLDGPDWPSGDDGFHNDDPSINPPAPLPPFTLAQRYLDNIFVTLVADVVTVTERTVRTSDL